MTHICVNKLTIIGSDNGLSPDRRQAIIWTNAGLLLIGPLGTNFNEILIEILTFSFKKMRLKVSSAKRRTLCLGLNVLINKLWEWFGYGLANGTDALCGWLSQCPEWFLNWTEVTTNYLNDTYFDFVYIDLLDCLLSSTKWLLKQCLYLPDS